MPKIKETRGRKKTLTKKQALKNNRACVDRWNKAHTKIINVRFNTETDKEVLDKLASVGNKADYIRQLILEDIKKG